MIRTTGSAAHLRKLARITGSVASLSELSSFSDENAFYRRFELEVIPPELREGLDEVRRARKGALPKLVTRRDVRGDLHTHTPLEVMEAILLRRWRQPRKNLAMNMSGPRTIHPA